METLLKKHETIFMEPQELPPPQSHDHKILLQDEVGLVNFRPYRYPFHQKVEIERQVEDMSEREELFVPPTTLTPHQCS
jgi:hypothetical protein